jgi:hypothetical protein
MRRRLLILLGTALLVTGCGGGDPKNKDGDRPAAAKERLKLNGADKPDTADFPTPKPGQSFQAFADSIGATGTQLALATSIFTPGHNRVAFGVLDNENAFAYGPTVLYTAKSPESTKVAGPYAAPADLLVTEPPFRSQQAATESDPFAAVYASDSVELDRTGTNYLLAVTKVGDTLVAAPSEIKVLAKSPVPAVGADAPKVATDTVATGGSEEAIDTRRPTAPELHQESFKDVVGKKPVALLFATPQLCQSRVCGPVVDIALQLKQEFGDQVEFIHQEVYTDNDANKPLRKPLQQFGLPTEPWLFTVSTDGKVAARLEGSFGLNAFKKAVQAAIARSQ